MINDDEPKIIDSPLCQRIEGDGTYIDVEIYRGEDEPTWILEVVDEENTSTLYDEPFESDLDALEEVMATIAKYGIRAYLENSLPDEDETVH